ncbi:zinc finger protein CONSTANS-LIKE 16 [Ziziphus jujuba]|uniref:Zinc finger protein CONSTANS-LIKE 16 n=1 Tax=Ziziphus jujuba TaxID=326968 RepID=A0ABM3IKR2_ZIZJJ|nr:zinc finger protein CONSTANS-LIKE 16 [Ziziphus jujuba]
MVSETKAANAMGGKTARACDSCLRKRARWFCAADDAFLCQSCDASVHSANQLASRHERVRLQTSSFKLGDSTVISDDSPPAWHRGFTRKARTPRHNKSISAAAKEDEKILINNNPLPFVPELSNEETSTPYYDSEEQLLYRVPIFDPFAAELCNEVGNSRTETSTERNDNHRHEAENMMRDHDYGNELDHLHGFLPSDRELAEFAADVESLLCRGVDEDSCDIKGLEILDCKEEGDLDVFNVNGDGDRRVKVEEEYEEEEEMEGILACEAKPCLDWNFGYESSPEAIEDDKVVSMAMETKKMNNEEAFKEQMKKEIFLRLNYEAVITAWDGQVSPWTTGIRPEVNPNNGWPDFMGFGPTDLHHPHGGLRGYGGGGARSDGGREARVSRYREKRRTRLFSKKIRYEVRKLNAEKRPRMKGRFVKRTSFMGINNGFPYIPKVVNK